MIKNTVDVGNVAYHMDYIHQTATKLGIVEKLNPPGQKQVSATIKGKGEYALSKLGTEDYVYYLGFTVTE